MITIYTETMRAAALDDPSLTDTDTLAYDEFVPYYLDYLRVSIARQGASMTTAYRSTGETYYADTDDEHQIMQSIPDFWEWY